MQEGCMRTQGRGNTMLNGQTWHGLTAKVSFEQRLEAGEGVSYVELWEEKISRKRKPEVNDPEAGPCPKIVFLK